MTTSNGEVPAKAALGAAGWELTGNHVVSLPLIDRASGAIARVGVLHRGAAGVVEWAGAGQDGLLAPGFRVDGAPAALGPLEWERLDGWIPRFQAELRVGPRAEPDRGAGHDGPADQGQRAAQDASADQGSPVGHGPPAGQGQPAAQDAPADQDSPVGHGPPAGRDPLAGQDSPAAEGPAAESTPPADAPQHGSHSERRDRPDRSERLRVRATICAPAGHEPGLRGAVYFLEIENRGRAEHEVEVALGGIWRRTVRRVLSERPWGERSRIVLGTGLVLEAGGIGPGLAIVTGGAGDELPHEVRVAVAGSQPPTTSPGEGRTTPDATAGPVSPAGRGAEREAQPGPTAAADSAGELVFPDSSLAHLRVARKLRVAPGKRAQAAFFLGVGPDGDGALATAVYLRGLGAAELLRRGRLELARLARTPDRAEWAGLINRALFFNYFFALGRAIDDDRFYPVSSRSPLLASGACFRERDALLWSLPGITLLDPWLAHEVLMRTLEQFAHRPGEALHYLDGAVLAPGFALDQACAYGLALERYAREAHDEHVHEDPLVQDVLRDLDDVLFHRLHPETFLASTELLPSGGPPDHPYVTYDNVLLWAFCQALPRLWVSEGPDDRPRLGAGADEIEAAVWHDCTTEVRQIPLIAWSVDLQGEAAVYDDPAGSLALLPALGFCAADDPLWSETLEFLRSARYPFWLGDHAFPGLAGRAHPEAAGLPALCADLLGPRKAETLALLGRLELDDGIACEAWHPDTGRPARGLHYAALAGFLGWALWQALEGPLVG